MSKVTTTFAERLRAACAAAQVEARPKPLAVASKLSSSLCHKYLNDMTSASRIPADSVFKLGDALNCNGRWLATGAGNPQFKLAQSEEENEVILIMRKLSDAGRDRVVECARGEAAKERVAPITERMRPVGN